MDSVTPQNTFNEMGVVHHRCSEFPAPLNSGEWALTMAPNTVCDFCGQRMPRYSEASEEPHKAILLLRRLLPKFASEINSIPKNERNEHSIRMYPRVFCGHAVAHWISINIYGVSMPCLRLVMPQPQGVKFLSDDKAEFIEYSWLGAYTREQLIAFASGNSN